MYVKIHNPKHSGGNTGSSSGMFDYLEKENEDREVTEHKHFFSHNEDGFSKYDATTKIDENGKGQLGKNDEKFFMLSFNPSAKELEHITEKYGVEKLDQALKVYTRQMMEEYALNFNRSIMEDTGEVYHRDNPEHQFLIEENEAISREEALIKREIEEYKKTTNDQIKAIRAEIRSMKEAGSEDSAIK